MERRRIGSTRIALHRHNRRREAPLQSLIETARNLRHPAYTGLPETWLEKNVITWPAGSRTVKTS
jgi:hypothetical protein